MSTIVRFAPSPTGRIHIGNARTALFNWLFSLKTNGRFILRFDDTDVERSRQEYADSIAEDLAWLGIVPDDVIYQSKRTDSHDASVAKLKEAGLLYPCYETPEELERRRKILLSRRLPPVYGREALKLSDAQVKAHEAEGRKPHWRFLLPNHSGDPFVTERTEVTFEDIVRGQQTVDLASMSDPVLVREDGSYLYTLPSVTDDIATGVTHVIRGDDHITNTGAQIALFEALGGKPPVFGHHNLLINATGEGLSKRKGALSLAALREDGFEPMAVASLATLIGTSHAVEAVASMAALADMFEPSMASKSPARFDPAELAALSRTLVHGKSFADVKEKLEEIGITGESSEEFWNAICGNIDKIKDARIWWDIVRKGPDSAESLAGEDISFARDAFDLLPAGDFDPQTWKEWTTQVKNKTGRKGRALFMPLRIALTGRSSGPELSDLLPLLGREGTLARRP